jgi:hypothetical protein
MFRSPLVDPCKHVRVRLGWLVSGWALLEIPFFQFYMCTLSKSFNRLRKTQIFTHLDEFENIPAGTAGKAFEYLLDAVDIHARCVIVVETADRDHFSTFFLQAHVFADHVNDVVGLLDSQDHVIVKDSH